MVHLLLMLAAVLVQDAYGRPAPPPLRMKGGCYVTSSEVGLFRVEGEAVILSFPMFARVLHVRRIAPSSARYVISKANGSDSAAAEDKERVVQSDKQLWFLPAKASDSGEYTCTYRNETYCVTGSIRLHVYEPRAADMEKLSFPITATVGEELTLKCPSIGDFNSTCRLIEWYKDSAPSRLQPGRGSSFQWNNRSLLIPKVQRSDAGVYTCQLNVVINNQQFKVSRALLLHVEGPAIIPSPTGPDLSITSDPGRTTTTSTTTSSYTPKFQRPVIVSPLNGSVYEIQEGSAEEMFCRVLTECEAADATEVTWLVNSQPVESSYLDGRALQGGRRVTRTSEGCQIELRLIVLAITEKDASTELRCVTQNQAGRQEVVTHLQLEDSTFTWLLVAVVAGSCFLTVVSVFLCVLFKPKRKKKMDYFLARQNSTF
ncbi:interleukin-1 receptor type 2 isoform X1 [Takifugu flavidus]|uniref:interleukin-1 receptor type 2 isoform X1 n=1 Tax=Takifugu flavidus TaxID=433684 RepID=UPI00254426D0|nr:interleukin-1 receptor type 2 isoform X1 [Takifugu flavidus]